MRFRNLKKQSKRQQSQEKYSHIIFASISEKSKAFITDMFMIYTPILYILTYVVMNGKDDFQASNWAPFLGVSLYALIYSTLVSKFGQTPGHKAYLLKVVDATTHKNLTFFRAFLRFIGFLISATFLFGLIIPFYREDKGSFHDLIANSATIKVGN